MKRTDHYNLQGDLFSAVTLTPDEVRKELESNHPGWHCSPAGVGPVVMTAEKVADKRPVRGQWVPAAGDAVVYSQASSCLPYRSGLHVGETYAVENVLPCGGKTLVILTGTRVVETALLTEIAPIGGFREEPRVTWQEYVRTAKPKELRGRLVQLVHGVVSLGTGHLPCGHIMEVAGKCGFEPGHYWCRIKTVRGGEKKQVFGHIDLATDTVPVTD